MLIDTILPAVPVDIECDGYVPLVIRFDDYKGPELSVPKYWRTGDFTHSLLEIAVNPSSGAICRIVVTSLRPLQLESLVTRGPISRAGSPVASLSQWGNGQERIDVKREVIGSLIDQEMTIIYGDVASTPLERIGCGRVTLLINHTGSLCGFQIGNLSALEIENIRYATGGMGA